MTLPLLLSLADELDNLNTGSYVDDFGLEFYPHRHYHAYGSRNNGWLQRHHKTETERPIAKIEDDGFEVSMDVQQFKPSELSVKAVEDCIIVEGKHDEREDEHGFVARRFVRRYPLPSGYNPGEVVSTLSSDGVLTVKVPPPSDGESSSERVIPIQQTGATHSSIKDNVDDEEEESSGQAKN